MILPRILTRIPLGVLSLAALLATVIPGFGQTVATYHGHNDRSGNFTMPQLTWDKARGLRLDSAFTPGFAGHLYAQPLYWQPAGPKSGVLFVATENNVVAAIEAESGNTVWSRVLGPPAQLSDFSCGNIDPLGITGTPVLDEAKGVLYLDAMVIGPDGPTHKLFALLAADGSTVPGWPMDVGNTLRGFGQDFDPRVQNQRGALLLLDGWVFVPYGGFYGDCGNYHGWVVGVSPTRPGRPVIWRTRAQGGGIWAPGGIAADQRWLYIATGNTEGTSRWADGEAVWRLETELSQSAHTTNFFAAADWRALDDRDADLGGSNPLPFDLTGGKQPLVLALGKDARAYLLDRNNLGGIGGALVTQRVSTGAIRTAPAVYSVAGNAYVAFQGHGADCPDGQRGDLTVLRIAPGAPPAITTAWCGAMSGGGSPIVTTTDGTANPIVWILGAEGDNRLHGYRGDTGEVLFTSTPLTGLRHFQTLIAAGGRLFVGADGQLYAFSVAP
jgi:hypothetical protein